MGAGGALQTGSCAANSSVVRAAVSKQCVGKNSCSVIADIEHMNAGTDPCPGTVKSVAVQLECSKVFPPAPPPAPPTAIRFVPGCDDGVPCTKTTGFANASAAAATADLTVVVVGLDQGQEKEGQDRTSLALPGNQSLLVEQTCAAARGACVVVVMTGGPVDLSAALVNPKVCPSPLSLNTHTHSHTHTRAHTLKQTLCLCRLQQFCTWATRVRLVAMPQRKYNCPLSSLCLFLSRV